MGRAASSRRRRSHVIGVRRSVPVVHCIEQARTRAQVGGDRRQNGACVGGRLVGRPAGPGIDHPAFLELGDHGAVALDHGHPPVVTGGTASASARCSAALRRRVPNRTPAVRARRAGGPVRRTTTTDDQCQQYEQDGQADRPGRGHRRAGARRVHDVLEQPLDDAPSSGVRRRSRIGQLTRARSRASSRPRSTGTPADHRAGAVKAVETNLGVTGSWGAGGAGDRHPYGWESSRRRPGPARCRAPRGGSGGRRREARSPPP